MPSAQSAFDPVEWIRRELKPAQVHTPELIYEHMESQSGRCLPLIYQPFDPGNPMHIADRGRILSFLAALAPGATVKYGGDEGPPYLAGFKVLDFGTGDGWPCLPLAQFVGHVSGVDGARKRVEVCSENAGRMGVTNAEFHYVEPGALLPFDDATFDGVTAASSIENTPDPQQTLSELARVLKPGGRLAMVYESLARYRGGQEREAWVSDEADEPGFILVYDRHIDESWVDNFILRFNLSGEQLHAAFAAAGLPAEFLGLTAQLLESLRPFIAIAACCRTLHPTGSAWADMLADAGFAAVEGKPNPREVAAAAWSKYEGDREGATFGEVDRTIWPAVRDAMGTTAPLVEDPMIVAVK